MNIAGISRVLAAACFFNCVTGLAQSTGDYPSRAIRMIVPQAAGGGLDASTRVIATRLTENLGQTIVIENRPSAGGIAGMEAVAKAAPDGYTVLMASATVALNNALGMKLPYDLDRDFAPVSLGVSIPMLFVAHPATAYRSLRDVVDDSKRQSGGVAVAIASIGTLPHLLAEMMRFKTGANLNLIFYKGAAPASLDALSGQIPFFIDAISPVGTHVAALTIGDQRRLHQAMVAALAHPEVRERLLKQGYEIHATTGEEYAAYMKNEIGRWSPIVKAAGIKAE